MEKPPLLKVAELTDLRLLLVRGSERELSKVVCQPPPGLIGLAALNSLRQ